MSPYIDPPWRPLPPIAPPQPTTRQRLKRLFGCGACYRRLQCDRCSIRSRSDGLLVCAVIQIVLAIASVILSTVKVIICGISQSVVWTYAFFLMMMLSGSFSAHLVRKNSENRAFVTWIVFVSFLMVTVTVLTLVYISNSFNGYLHSEPSTPTDHFCHDGYTWTAYINVHYITTYFVEVSGAATAMVQGIIALTLAIKRWGLCPRRQGSADVILEEQSSEDDENAQSISESENDTDERALQLHNIAQDDEAFEIENAHTDSESEGENTHTDSEEENGHTDGRELQDPNRADVWCHDCNDLLQNSSDTCMTVHVDDHDFGHDAGRNEDSAVLIIQHDPSGQRSDDTLLDDDDLRQQPSCDDDIALIDADDV